MPIGGKFYRAHAHKSPAEMAEMALIGTVLVSQELFQWADVEPGQMASSAGKYAWTAMLAAAKYDGSITPENIAFRMEGMGCVHNFGYIADCLDAAGCDRGDVKSYVRVLRESAIQKETEGE